MSVSYHKSNGRGFSSRPVVFPKRSVLVWRVSPSEGWSHYGPQCSAARPSITHQICQALRDPFIHITSLATHISAALLYVSNTHHRKWGVWEDALTTFRTASCVIIVSRGLRKFVLTDNLLISLCKDSSILHEAFSFGNSRKGASVKLCPTFVLFKCIRGLMK